MAEKTIQKVEEQLNCSICLDTYTDPKLLRCFHAYCQQCLVRLVVRDQQGQLVLTCPTCRQVTPVPANGVAGLQSAFHINHLLEIMEEHKKAADQSASEQQAKSDSTSHSLQCCTHEGKELELYCKTCEELVCLKCITKGGKHRDHDHELLTEAFEKYKKEISPSFSLIEQQLAVVNKALAQLETRCGEISDQRAAIEGNIHKDFGRLHKALDARKTILIGQLHQITRAKLKKLAVQRDQIETTLAKLNSCLHFMKESFKTDSQGEVLMMKTTIVKQVQELTTTDIVTPNTEADMTFLTLADLTEVCQRYGQISVSTLPDPAKCYLTVSPIEVLVGKSTAILQAISYHGQPCTETGKSFECKLVSEITGARGRSSAKRIGQSLYEISYQPSIKGRHQLHISIDGQHIKESPFRIAVKSSIENLGKPLLTICAGGWGVAINQRGEVVVSEVGEHCISVFSPSGEKIRRFGTRGSAEGQLEFPEGIAVDKDGFILIANDHHIQKFTFEGQFLAAVGTEGSGRLQFKCPGGIAVNSTNNKVYVCDRGNDRLQILNPDLTFSSTFGKEGSDKGQFSRPVGIACDRSGNVYVADCNDRIQVFTAEGNFLRMFGRRGEGRGELRGPIGIAVDTSNMVYVSEFNNHRVSVFTSEGQFVTSFGRWGSRLGELSGPVGVAVDNSGVVYVCDINNHRLQLF